MRAVPQVTKHVPGVWSVPVPIPDSPLGYTLVYVLESDRGPYLVDAGWDSPGGLAALTEGLNAVGTSIADVQGVLVTHFHRDHHGLAGHVREASGAWIALHRNDAAIVNHVQGPPTERQQAFGEMLRIAGAPEEAVASGLAARPGPPSLAVPDRLLDGGELMDVPGRTVKAVWTPGHSPGHTCFLLEDRQALLAGDHLLPGITPHIGTFGVDQDADPLGEYLASLRKTALLDVRHVFPAHEYVFADAAGRAREILDHHEERLRAITDSIGDGELTLWDVAAGMKWNRDWSEMPLLNQPMAIAEAGAHVRHLTARGLLEIVPGSEPLRFRRRDASPARTPARA